MLIDKSEEILKGLYKSASFVIQAIAFKKTEKYTTHQKDLINVISPDEYEKIYRNWRDGKI